MIISIITVNRNNAEGLKKTIASVKLQNRNIIEFIIVDGASTDNSLSVIYNNKNIIDHLISEPDLGIYDAMNKGIDVATGEYILFLNSGDIFYSQAVLDRFAEEAFDQDFVLGGVCFKHGLQQYKSYLPDKMRLFDFLEGVCHQGTFIKRKVLLEMGKYNLKYKIIADWALLIDAVLLKNCSYATYHECISYYNLDGLSSKISSKQCVVKEKNNFILEKNIKYNKLFFYLYRFSYRILRIRIFYIMCQFKSTFK